MVPLWEVFIADTKHKYFISVWFYVNRTLQCLALASAVLATILFVIYSFTPRPFAFDIVRGFVFLDFTIGKYMSIKAFVPVVEGLDQLHRS